ncbi:Zn-dependent protease with chaperone function [Fictibacillus barbaricus]|uniref:Zn-dependent protease with chaperone function n=1 Tax=Fictibacillus barbaricus TaxID=182136 RepID=A0ABU1U1U6_9BACL|nr:Zn-dependent protease with chaperone function [Fictibacillus barbaricus]
MNKFFFSLLLLMNLIYIADFLINFGLFPLGRLWLALFIFSFILSIVFLWRSRKEPHYNPYLSIALLVTSFSCIGTYFFQYFLTNLMG